MAKVRLIPLIILCVFTTSLASAQTGSVNRTFVSAQNGSDGNPCTPAQPCRTFARAFAVTNTGGEIVVQDAGGFGYININRALQIRADNAYAGIIVTSAGNGIDINAGTDKVVLRGLTLNSQTASSTTGIQVGGVGQLFIEDSTIAGFTTGINFAPSAGGSLYLKNSELRNNGTAVTVGNGGTAAVYGSFDKVRLEGNTSYGLLVQGASAGTTIRDSVIGGNSTAGISSKNSARVNVENCAVVSNTSGLDVASSGTIRSSNSVISSNTNALTNDSTGFLVSLVNNRIAGNTSNGTFTSTIAEQ